jgi:hypothetical protein
VPTTEEQLVDEQLLHRGAPAKLARRVHVPLPEHLFRYLKRANAEDDIDTTVRIRAMIELYEHDQRHRTRVDKIAKKRNDELIWAVGTPAALTFWKQKHAHAHTRSVPTLFPAGRC